jgi:cation transport ATPase
VKYTGMLLESIAAVYSNGKLYAVSSQDLDKVHAATVAALKQLEIEVTETTKDVFYAKVVGKVADDNTITIRLEPGADDVTNIRIKASRFGNEERSRVIYNKIKENL